MKISTLEKLLLGFTAAFLLLSGGYLLGSRSAAQPYRVEVQALPVAAPPTAAPSAGTPSTGTPSTGPLPSTSVQLVNINTATAEELQTLPGIGERRATDIVAYRTANGPFRRAEDLTLVKGIGEGILAGLLDYITVDG